MLLVHTWDTIHYQLQPGSEYGLHLLTIITYSNKRLDTTAGIGILSALKQPLAPNLLLGRSSTI